MSNTTNKTLVELQAQTKKMLRELGLPCHRIGYQQLLLAVPLFATDGRQSMTKELYAHIADYWSYSDWHAVERSIRTVILYAWLNKDSVIWESYFPDLKKVPSNKLFIATLAERLK